MEKSSELFEGYDKPYNIKSLLSTNFNSDPELAALGHKISIAPMMDITNVHFRFFMRLLTRHATLYTEMIHENTILHTNMGYKELLKFNTVEHPVVIQFGGNSPDSLAQCAKWAEELGYDEINLNIGCPSPRVQAGAFGACLMKEPGVVADCIAAMRKVVQIPVHIKCRLGVDDHDSYEFAHDFIKETSEKAGCSHYVIHARKAFLKGLSPAENRNVPPLQYDRVMKLKKDLPKLEYSINGGFKTIDSIVDILKPENGLKGCMLGRVAYENPWVLSDVDRVFYGKKNQGLSRKEILEVWGEYGQSILDENPNYCVPNLVKPIINLFANEKSGSRYRQYLGCPENFKKHNKSFKELIEGAVEELAQYNKEVLAQKPCLDNPKEKNE